MIAVYFKLPDGETVLYGKYHSAHRKRTASEALAHYLAEENKLGTEFLIGRSIAAKEIHRIKLLPQQFIGWRYMPGSHQKTLCSCSACRPTGIKSRKLREKLARLAAADGE